jgi:dCMP deaminase
VAERGAEAIFLIGDSILAAHDELDYINRKDRLRAIPVERMQKALEVLTELPVEILTKENAGALRGVSIIAPQEDITELLVREYFKEAKIEKVPIFLRWHRDNTAEEKAVEAHRRISVTDLDRELMGKAFEAAEGSFDWWRQVGSVIAKDGEILFVGYNKHMPEEQSPNINGDPRAVYKRGVAINLTTALHGEGALIAEAARQGISLNGASIYVTDFPCPYCARMIAHCGIKKCYFARGYAMLDGEEILKGAGIELVYIDIKKEQG